MEELLAHIGEKGSKGLKLKAQELIGFIRDWLRKKGYFELSKLGATDMAYLAKSAREAGLGNKVSKRGDIRFMVAWHGSPHDHNKFSTDHIGSGEGAQVYGWGLYFSRSKDVAYAKNERRNLKGLDKINVIRNPTSKLVPEYKATKKLLRSLRKQRKILKKTRQASLKSNELTLISG